MKNVCIVCGTEFESERRARFCPDKPGCRQSYNRRERRVKDLAEQIAAATDELLAATADRNISNLATNTLIDAEKKLIARLDKEWPNRHPQKPITARPIRVDNPQTFEGKVFAFGAKTIGGLSIYLRGKVRQNHDGWIEGQIGDGWHKETILLSEDCLFIRLEEPETDESGRDVVDRYNKGWGAVVNPDRQIEIAPVPANDEDYSEDDEEYEDDDA